MRKIKIPKKIKDAMARYVKLDAASKEATSAKGKQNTVVKNLIKTTLEENDAPYGSFFHTEGYKIFYAATESEIIAPEDLYDMLVEEQITKQQFLDCIKVNITDVKRVLGGDVAEALKQPVTGDKADVRMEKLGVDDSEDEYFLIADKPVIKRRKLVKKDDLREKKKAMGQTRGRKLRLKR